MFVDFIAQSIYGILVLALQVLFRFINRYLDFALVEMEFCLV